MDKISIAVYSLLEVMRWTIFARIILSWFPMLKGNRLMDLLYQITEPILAPIRAIIEKTTLGKNMMLDFSPVIAFLLISLIEDIL